jgi:hypothetical protein
MIKTLITMIREFVTRGVTHALIVVLKPQTIKIFINNKIRHSQP